MGLLTTADQESNFEIQLYQNYRVIIKSRVRKIRRNFKENISWSNLKAWKRDIIISDNVILDNVK